ncbi:MAG TPA: efflux RND transporter periplasmic adaptor subunit, partial [Candidatus Manganitrophaceae bacterium]|nr:efflux RND transporter periplasmic adaptor subunit [Candidatus Manganitrophaceae bacterium]
VFGMRSFRTGENSAESALAAYGDIRDQIAARGKVEAKTTVDLSSKIDGRVKLLPVKEGEFVKEGAVVITLDDAYAKASVAQARAELKDAQLKYARAGRLFDTKAVPQAQLEEAESRFDLSKAQLERALALLEDMHIASPISGKVIDKYREVGESVKAGAPILTVADVSAVRVRAEIDEDDIGALALGQEATITSDAYPSRVFHGKVVEIGEEVGKRSIQIEDPSKITDTKVLEAKIDLAEREAFKLGMTVDIKIDVVRRDHVLKIPRRAIRQDDGGPFVVVLKNNRREVRRVVLGAVDPWDAEIRSGLLENEKVALP